jgi:choline dehydrogenase
MSDYDYLVVGGGTAGSVLAARLSEDPDVRVVLLEAGPGEGPAAIADPSAWLGLWGSPVDWADTTVPQAGTDNAVHSWPRGKLLGGSSSINGMVHLRGDQSSYDRWETAGATGWNYNSLLPFLKRSERAEGRDPQVRGTDGPMVIEPNPAPDPLASAWYDAAVQAGHKASADGNGHEVEGLSWTDMNVVGGKRQSAADAYLRPNLGRPNLTVITGAQVRRLLLDGTRCYGAEYVEGGAVHTVRVEREVLLAAGALGSPQLLMLSGLGPAQHLRSLGIDPVVNLPGVGRNLHDHLVGSVSYAAAQPMPAPSGAVPHALFRSDDQAGPDLQIGFVGAVLGPRWALEPTPGYSVLVSLMAPAGRGSVRLSGPETTDPLVIDAGYFGDEESLFPKVSDLDRMVIGLQRARELGEADALAPWRGAELHPGADVRVEQACRDYLRRTVRTYFHYVGTCRIGTDDLSVVDPLLRVRGIDGLRIADASVMPTIVSANTNATVLAIAERAASLVGRGSEPR